MEITNKDEPNISNIDSFSQNISNIREINEDNFEDNLNISDIKDEMKKIKKDENPINKNRISLNIFTNQSIDNDFSEDFDNINEDEFNQRKISIGSLQSSNEVNSNNMNINLNIDNINNKRVNLINKRESKKITKEELNNIPLPLFSCIYCSNEIIASKHLLQEIITNKYLFQTSIYDIQDINKLMIYQPLVDKDDKNEKLLDIIIKNTEYIYSNYNNEYIYNFFKSENYIDLCNKEKLNNKKYFMQKIEESIVKKKKDFYFKGINKIPKNSMNNRCLFNSTNSLINNYNALSGFVETTQINNNNINICKNNNNTNNNSNLSINFNSISLNNNDIGNCLGKDNINLLVSIVEHIENNNEGMNEIEDKEEIMDFFEFDNDRKITKENIIWENNYYDIWNPIISDEEDINDINYNSKENIEEINEKRYKLKVNLLKSKTSNNSFNYKMTKKLSVSQVKSIGSTNSSSIINCDNNDNKIKSNIFSHSKDKNNYSTNTIHVNTIKINENEKKKKNNNSMEINRSISIKSKNVINGLINNQLNAYPSFINNSTTLINKTKKRLKNNLINKVSSSVNFKINNNFNNSNNGKVNTSKYKKNKIKKFDTKEKNKKKENNKNYYNKINNFNNTTKSYYHYNNNHNNTNHYNSNTMNKTIGGSRLTNISTSTSINGNTKIISSKLIFKRHYNLRTTFTNNNNNYNNYNFNNYNNYNYQKLSQNNINNNTTNNTKKMKLSYCSISKTNDKECIDKIRKKISEITKIINNNKNCKNYNYHMNNKINSSLYKSSVNQKNSKIKSKYDMVSSYCSNNNNKLRMSNEIKTNIVNKNKKLFLSTSFLIKPKTKIIEKNSFKKYK